MVIPLPNISMGSVPSAYTLGMRKWFYLLTVIMFVCAMARMYIFLDIIGGFMLCVIAGIGLYCLREGTVDMNCLVTWGMVCCINGVMDTLIVIDRMVKITQPIFKAERGLFENTLWALYLVGPVAEIISAILVYLLYKENVTDGGAEGYAQHYGSMPSQDAERSPTLSPQSPQQPAFKPFQGAGNKLGEGGQAK